MADDKNEGVTVTVTADAISLTLTYPDGSQVQLTMPKPAGVEGQTREQVELQARRMGRRLLDVALEDLAGAALTAFAK